jgi:hypothetical protein
MLILKGPGFVLLKIGDGLKSEVLDLLDGLVVIRSIMVLSHLSASPACLLLTLPLPASELRVS